MRKLLAHIESRSSSGAVDFSRHNTSSDKALLERVSEDVRRREGKGRGKEEGEEVVLKATGKAIEKGLRLATWWMGQEDVVVRVRTGSVGAVDDVVNVGEGGKENEEEEEGSRVRRTSCLEVGISLR